MNIKLVNPPSPFLINERVFPNIGLVRVATALQAKGHDTEILDFAGVKPEDIILPESDVYGFSSTTPQFPYVYQLHQRLKREQPKVHTVLGGPHASSLYSLKRKGIPDINVTDLDVFDTVFVGEGELDNVDLMFLPGWRQAPVIKDLDAVAIPDRSLIDLPSYSYFLNGRKTTTIQTQRGCPGQCTFCCGRDIDMYRKVRQHSPQRVLQELDQLHDEYGFDSFMWYDDEINLNPKRLEELCAALAERDYQHRGFIRSDYMVRHPEMAGWLKDAGFVKLCAGVESGSDRILKKIQKGTTSAMNSEARRLVGEAGIHYESFILLGHPGETPTDISLSYQWLVYNNPDDFDVNLITPYPGSKMYDGAVPSTEFDGYDWEYKGAFFNKPRFAVDDSYYKGHNAQSHSDIRTKLISNKRLKAIRDMIDVEARV